MFKNININNITFLRVLVIILSLLAFINPAIYGYNVRIILQYTVVGLMLIPYYFLFKVKKVYDKSYVTELILYAIIIIITIYNAMTQNSITHYYAILQGRLPAFLSLQTYVYSLVFVVIISSYFKDIFTKNMVIILYAIHIVLGIFIVITHSLGVGIPLYFGYGNANYVGEPFAIMYLFIVLPRLVKRITITDVSVSSLFLYFALYSNSRATQLSIIIALSFSVFYAFIKKNIHIRTFVIVVLQLLTVMLILYITSKLHVLNLSDIVSGDITINTLSSGRLQLWKQIIESTTFNYRTLFFGLGPSTFIYYGATNYNAHNMIVEMFGSMGLIGLIASIYIFISLALKTLKLSTKEEHQYIAGLLVFLIVKWNLNSMMALTSFYFLIIIGLIIHKYREEQHVSN